jgi:hypothetical protein
MDGRDGDMDGSVDSLEPYFAGFEAGVLRLGSFLLNITPRQKVAAVSGGVSVELCRVCHHLASLIGSRNDAQIFASLRSVPCEAPQCVLQAYLAVCIPSGGVKLHRCACVRVFSGVCRWWYGACVLCSVWSGASANVT